MKIAHLSDTHLGYAGPGQSSWVEHPWKPNIMVRQWEADLMLGLARAIDAILEQIHPDLVIHTGDLFDCAMPTPHNIDFAMTQFKRLSMAGIPVALVEGAHSYPRDHTHGHVLTLLAHLDGVTVFCERDGNVRVGEAVVHAFPYVAAARGRAPTRDSLDDSSYNILAAYVVADGLRFFKRQHRPAGDLAVSACVGWYDYVALGHYHRFAQVPETECAFYAGSTAMVTWNDLRPGYSFGVNVVELVKGNSPVVSRTLVETRPMHSYGLDDAQGFSATEILELLARQVEAIPPERGYCRTVVLEMDPQARREIDVDDVRALFEGAAALRIELQPRVQRWDGELSEARMHSGVKERFVKAVKSMELVPDLESEVIVLGRRLLKQAADDVSAEDAEDGYEEPRNEGDIE
jgi:DNA repair protein SbcD/Mre11